MLPPMKGLLSLPAIMLLGALAGVSLQGRAVADDLDERTRQMVEQLRLVEAATPIRDTPGWRRPERVLIRRLPADRRAWFEAAAPGVKLVSYASEAEAIARAPEADAVLGTCSAAVLAAGPRIRWIQAFYAGVETCVAIPAIRDRGILLTNMQRVGAPPMADHVMAMLLTFSRGLNAYREAQRESRWAEEDRDPGAFGLDGKTMFIAGLGGTGLEVAQRAHAFGMRVTGTRASSREAPPFVSQVGLPGELPDLVAQADVVVNTLPLTPATSGLFDARIFARMKKGAYFINVGRGGTVVTADLLQALRSGTLAGAGLDVVEPEPLPAAHPLWKLPNVIITPHVAAQTDDSENRWLLVRENLRRYAAGERMLSVVDAARGY